MCQRQSAGVDICVLTTETILGSLEDTVKLRREQKDSMCIVFSKLAFDTRLNEHQRAVEKGNSTSAVAPGTPNGFRELCGSGSLSVMFNGILVYPVQRHN